MQSFQLLLSRSLDFLLGPIQTLSPLWALVPFSLLAGILLLLVFRYTSNQQRIRETKDSIKAHILELWLFRDDPRILLSAQGRILRLNGRYIALALKPMLVSIIPLALLLTALDGWFAFRPLFPGEEAIVSIRTNDGTTELFEKASLAANHGLTVETPPLRISPTKEIDWRIKAHEVGVHKVSVELPGRSIEKQIVVSRGLARVSFARLDSGFWQALLYPSEPPLPQQSGLERIDIHYPERAIQVSHWRLHWLIVFFVLSTLSAFAFRRLLKVEL